ncbi:MAG: hypothetical protein OCD01_01215 [Fibrobacterales bacterium]
MLGELEIKVYRPRKMLFFMRLFYPMALLSGLTGYVFVKGGVTDSLMPFYWSVLGLYGLYFLVFIPYYFLTRICYLTMSEKHLFVKRGFKLLTDRWDKYLLSEVSSYQFILKAFNKVLVLENGQSKQKIYLNWLNDPKNIISLLYYNYAPIIKNSRPEIKEFMDSL